MSLSEVTFLYDAQNKFRAPGQPALTASGVIGTLPLDKLVAQRPNSQRNRLGAEGYNIIVVVNSIDKTGGDEVYTLQAKVGAVGAENTIVGALNISSTGQYVLELDSKTIMHQDADHASIKLELVAAGTTPIISFCSWLMLDV
jgi:hypothetical protein